MSVATLSSKYQISIPKDVREAMHLKPGQQLAFLRVGASLRLVPVREMKDLFGIAKGLDTGDYRDRSTRREKSLPGAEVKVVATQKKAAVPAAKSAAGARVKHRA